MLITHLQTSKELLTGILFGRGLFSYPFLRQTFAGVAKRLRVGIVSPNRAATTVREQPVGSLTDQLDAFRKARDKKKIYPLRCLTNGVVLSAYLFAAEHAYVTTA